MRRYGTLLGIRKKGVAEGLLSDTHAEEYPIKEHSNGSAQNGQTVGDRAVCQVENGKNALGQRRGNEQKQIGECCRNHEKNARLFCVSHDHKRKERKKE